MPRPILIIIGHPDSDPKRLCRALAASYADGARSAGHEVRPIDIATLDFPLLRTMEEFEKLPLTLEDTVHAIRDAEHIVFIFPLWLGTMPALLKAYLEVGKGGFAAALLKGRSAWVIVTMGMPAFFYRLWYLGHGIAGMRRNILNFVGISPVRETLFGMVEDASDATRQKWLAKMRALGVRAV